MSIKKHSNIFEIKTKWVVITGGPSSGKTTTVNKLKSLGLHSSPEAARTMIDLGISSGLTVQEIRRNENNFNHSTFCIQMAIENVLLPDKLCFHDRGIPDSLAYIRLYDGDEIFAKKFATKRKYDKIFLLDLLPFQKDYARTEEAEMAKQIEQLIHQAYEELEYKVIRVPILTIEERVNFILNSMGISKNINASDAQQ